MVMDSKFPDASNVDSLPPPRRSRRRQKPALQSPRKTAPTRKPSDPGFWLVEALADRWKMYRQRLQECQQEKEPSEESVHELRVATRRLISQLLLLGCIVPSRAPKKARQILKRQLGLLGPLRDVHVQRLAIEKETDRFPELLVLRSYFERREQLLIKTTVRQIRGFQTKKLRSWISKTLVDLTRRTKPVRQRDALTSAALCCAHQTLAAVRERRQTIDPADLRTIHRTRIAFKRFRYVVEALPSEVTGLRYRQLRRLAAYQRRMGRIQDLEVIFDLVTRFLDRHQGIDGILDRFLSHLQQRRAQAVRVFLKSSDQLLDLGNLDNW
jgi:CHAD domain-containing protein